MTDVDLKYYRSPVKKTVNNTASNLLENSYIVFLNFIYERLK